MDIFDDLDSETSDLGDTVAETAAVTRAFRDQLLEVRTATQEVTRDLGSLEGGFSSGLKRAFDGVVLDGMRLSDALSVVGKAMSDTVYNNAVKPVTSHLGGLMAEGVTNVVSGLMPFADGGAFSAGRVTPFAKGGVVGSPVTFPMRGGTGLMGEAGPEAIMPLSRTADGRLGVAAQGGSAVNVTMNITTPDVQGFARSRGQIAAQMARAIGQGQRNR